jgi:hypothetical protein
MHVSMKRGGIAVGVASGVLWTVISSSFSPSDFISSVFGQYWDLDEAPCKHCTLELHPYPILLVINFSDGVFLP